MTHWSLLGRRVLAVGPSLAPLARGPLFGAALEMACAVGYWFPRDWLQSMSFVTLEA